MEYRLFSSSQCLIDVKSYQTKIPLIERMEEIMSKVAVVYWSGTGNTEAMAYYVTEGAKAAGLR